MTILRTLSVLLLPAALSAQVSPELADLIKKEGLEQSRVMHYLDHLTNQIGHRLTGSSNFQHACEWTKSEFEKMGLEVKLEKWGEWSRAWNRGQWQGRVLGVGGFDLQVATDAWTPGTKGLQRGAVVEMPRKIEEIGEEHAGKWLIARRMPRRGNIAAAAAAGALGVLYSSRGDRKHPNRIRVFGSYRTPQRGIPRIAIRRDQFQKFWEMV